MRKERFFLDRLVSKWSDWNGDCFFNSDAKLMIANNKTTLDTTKNLNL
jgi:hypothetical protein